ncbi:uncharacterized protein LOC116291781 [Actinia tenebrosa]|uniref:Uncharacterized protein LOC116291781 n=1 Tax=Actinia tenebrosa TaxID=6105 RepID=A0A6P8HEJ8_ACTTE|nr:uncharacterized protein LOC116291781 [Actinia tenebrosa]
MKCPGKFKAQLHASSMGKTANEEIYVVKNLERSLLGRKAAMVLKLIMQVDNVNKNARVFEKYPELFTGLGRMKDEHSYSISLKEDVKPFAVTVPRKVPLPLYKETKTKKELEKIRKQESCRKSRDRPNGALP